MTIRNALFSATLLLLPFMQPLAASFVIVHGAFQNAQSWALVADAMRSKGHSVVAVELPGRNAQGSEAKAISIAHYAETVNAAISKLPAPVTLIGHSFGGITISLAGSAAPEKIKKLIYIAAYVPQSGESMQSLASQDKTNGFTEKSFVVSPDYSFATILEEDRARLFINDGSADIQKAVVAAMLREPLTPISTRLEIDKDVFRKIDKAYIQTKGDKTVSPTLQSMMIQRAGITTTADIETGHLPQATKPQALADMILALSK